MKFNVSNMTKSLSRNTKIAGLKVKKASPEIAIVVGTVAIVGGVIAACKATTKLEELKAKHKEKIDEIHDAIETIEADPDAFATFDEDGHIIDTYTEQDSKRDLFIVYRNQVFDIVKLYALPVLSIGLGLGCFYGSHHVLAKRNAALAAAYASIDRSFKQYRNRVVERFGKDMDNELRYDIKTKEFEEKVTDAKGKEKTVTKKVDVVSNDPSTYSEFARYFDESCSQWENDANYNRSFLTGMQQRANDELRVRGFMFLNDVYKLLGFPPTKAGQIVGWTYNKETGESLTVDEDGKPIGDGKIDFGIFEGNRERNRAFVNGYEPVIILDFNVEGNILDLIDEAQKPLVDAM